MSTAELLEAATSGGARSLGYLEEESEDRTYLDLEGSLDMAGWQGEGGDELLARLLFGASPADVDEVVVAGRRVVEGGEHVSLGPPSAIAAQLSNSVRRLLGQ